MDDDLFDGDFDAEDASVIGGFMGILEEEEEEEKKRKKLEKEMMDKDDPTKEHEENGDY